MAKIAQKQIEQHLSPEQYESYGDLMKALSAAGFTWNPDDSAWHRDSDDAGFTDESLRDLAVFWPALVGGVIKLIRRGAPGISVSLLERNDGLTVTLNVMGLLDRMAEAAQ